jgi:hypothetical protein
MRKIIYSSGLREKIYDGYENALSEREIENGRESERGETKRERERERQRERE